MIAKSKINSQGRIVLPAECREAAGMKPGTEVMVDVVGKGELRLRTRDAAIRRAQALVAKYISKKDHDVVAELIAARRKEAARE